jgi:putative salt-induced outer membrane protein YdiY
MIKHTFATIIAMFLAIAGQSACAQTAYWTDYYWPQEASPVNLRVERLPPVDEGPSLALQTETLEEVVPAPDGQEVWADPQSDADPQVDAIEVTEAAEEAPPPIKLWEGSCELGFNGSEGNSQTLDFRFGFDAKRKTDANIIDLDLDYHKKTADNQETANRMFLDSRYEWLQGDSPWTSFVHQTTEYDEFKAYNVRVTLDMGVGYQFLDNDATSLMARLGSGVSHEIDGPDRKVVPELTCGLDFEHQLTKRQKFKASTEYMPDVTNCADFRLTTKLDWEVLLDEDWNLSLKLGLLDRYDSTPNGSKPNDLDYSITLLWSF